MQTDPPPSDHGGVNLDDVLGPGGALSGRKQILPLILLGAGLVALVILAVVLTFSKDRQNETDRLVAIADLKSGQVEIWFQERMRDAQYVGMSSFLQELATNWRQRQDSAARDRIFDRLEQTRRNYAYEGVYFYDGLKNILQDGQKQEEIDDQLEGALRESISSGKVKYIGPYLNKGRIVLDFVAPLATGSQKTGAAVVLRTDPTRFLFPLLKAWPYASRTGESMLLRRDGSNALYLSDLRFQPNAAARFRAPLKERDQIVARALRGETQTGGLIEGIDYRKAPALGVVRPIKGSDWHLVTKLELSEVNDTGVRSAVWISLLGFLTLLVLIGVAVALRQRQLLLDSLIKQAEQDERIRSLELLDAISASSSDSIFAKDLDGRYLFCNEKAARIMGMDASKVIGRDDMSLFPHATAEQFVANDQFVLALGKATTFEETFGDGAERTSVQSTKGPLRDRKGAIIGVFGFARNITAQKRSESQLRESEERFRKLFEDTRQPSMLIEDGRFVAANAAALSALGLKKLEQFIGRTPVDISPDFQPDGRTSDEKARENVSKAFEQGSHEFEWEHVRANGEHFIARVLLTSIRQGGKDLLHVVWNDITAQKEAEKKIVEYQKELENRVAARTAELTAVTETLRQANEERQAVFDAATVGVILTRGDRIVRCNRTMETLFGYDRGELDGLSTRYLYPGDATYDETMKSLKRSLREIGSYRDERQLRRKDGSLFWCREMAQAIDRNNLDSGFASTFEDVTLERAALEEMQKAKALAEDVAAAKANFLANMSHEIRTPMNAVIGMTHLALRANPDPRVRDFLLKIRTSSEHLLGIINDILDFSKIEAGKMEIEKVDFELETILDNSVALIAEKAASKDIEVIIDIARDVPGHLMGDPLRIQQILVNYLNNAVKFTERGEIVLGVTALRVNGPRAELKFTVRDSGIGIAKEQQSHLFQSFHQLDPSTTRKFGGTGLGLAIVKRLAEAMGGAVGVDSVQGKGSTFWFTAAFELGQERGDEAGPRRHLQGRRILVVDDHPEARDVLVGMLRSMGFETASLGSGEEALDGIRTASEAGTPFDIVFLDWKMPGMNGLMVAAEIRKLALERPPVVLMVTAYDRNDLLRSAAHVHIDDVLCKPVTPSTLLDTILRVMGAAGSSLRPAPSSDDDEIATVRERLRGVKILLVEDNELNQEVASGLLEDLGAVVDVASDGAKAIEMARAGDHDIILMDVQMPVMDGISATRALRAEPRFREVPILAMTASVLRNDRDKCIAAGMNDHIAKPINPSELAHSLLMWAPVRKHEEAAPQAGEPRHGPEHGLPAEIEGLDMTAGLRRVLGKRELYLSLLRKFVAGNRNMPARIRETLDAGNMEEAERLAHTMKGVAGNLGAVRVQEAAADLELSIRERRPREALDPSLEAHEKALGDLLLLLERRLPPEPAAAAVDLAKLDAFCDRLNLFLTESDALASDLLTENADLLRAAFPAHFPALEKSVQAFDYETAVRILGEARAGRRAQ